MTEKAFRVGGYDYITAKIEEAVCDGSRTAVISGCWEIDRAIRLPSHFTLILENCHLRQADGCFDNIFVNQHHDTEIGRTRTGTDRNISILGRGEAILDGGSYNGLSEKTQRQNGLPPICVGKAGFPVPMKKGGETPPLQTCKESQNTKS